jgi:NAD-dependent SIR2 family protein deacetylase
MKELDNDFSQQMFLGHYVQNAPQLMWFLGAGTSRTAGMPTATDIIWDLKRKYYCLQENQDLQAHDINNQAIRRKIQNYVDSKGFPTLWSQEEYSFYFDLTFGDDYGSQHRYIREQFDSKNISLNIGHRVLAALLEMGLGRVVYTTNFDEVIETAFSAVAGKQLATFHLEGSYAALDALNAEQFPIYAKIHGDFRYQKIKNLTADLLHNDDEIQKCFLAASTRYGLIVAGYSGRDANVMAMFNSALEQNNAFPQGLFWLTPRLSDVTDSVHELISSAREKGVRAHIIESGPFDVMLSKMWRQLPEKPEHLDLKVRTAKALPVSIPLPPAGTRYPILRPRRCASVDYAASVTFRELKDKVWEHQPNAILSYTDQILFWGDPNEIYKILDKEKVKAIKDYNFDDSIVSVMQSGIIKSFFDEAVARSLCHEKPLLLRRKDKTYYAVVSHEEVKNPLLQPIKEAVGYQGKPGDITGSVPEMKKVFWAEGLSTKLEERNGSLWLLIRPDIWITPLSEREKATDFLYNKKIRRYNNQSYGLLDAWIRVLFGFIGTGQEVQISCFPDSDYSPTFSVNTRTAFSRGRGANE